MRPAKKPREEPSRGFSKLPLLMYGPKKLYNLCSSALSRPRKTWPREEPPRGFSELPGFESAQRRVPRWAMKRYRKDNEKIQKGQ